MSFDSVTFWIFFPLVWLAWRRLPFGAAKSVALLSSLVFYGWWDPRYLILIAVSSVIDYYAGARIAASEDQALRKRWLLISLVSNFGLLGFFKYGPFTLRSIGAAATGLGFENTLDDPARFAGWIVPVGISFYTFQTLSYTIDVYRRQLAPAASFRDFALYVTYFPQLVAGPIVRAAELLPQFRRRRRLRFVFVQAGVYRIVVGLFLKVVIADNLARPVGAVFESPDLATLSATQVWLGVVYFAVQIFADFAGYSGIAMGLAYLMGLRFPINFRYPYISRGLSEFWTRWHVTLSSWLRDYLYIPLGGNRHGPWKTSLFLMTTMLLGGLWHGASWTFVAWGGLHGLGLCVERLLRGERRKPAVGRPSGAIDLVTRVAQMIVVLVFVLTTWVFFRAQDFGNAATVLERMFVAPWRGEWGWAALGEARFLILVAPIALLHLGQVLEEWYGLRKRPWMRALVAAACLAALCIVRRDETVEFIYFQF